MKIRRILLALLVLVCAVGVVVQPAAAQQYVQKWDMYGGYTHLNIYSPSVNMSQYGYNLSFGRNINNWLALGADFSNFRGTGAQTTSGIKLAAKIPPELLAGLPSSYQAAILGTSFNVPLNAETTTFALGTQFQLRKTKWITPIFGPFLGAFHSKGVGKAKLITAKDPAINTLLAPVLAGIVGSVPQPTLDKWMTQDATVLGYGVRGGLDFNLSKPIGLRISTEYIRTPLFGERQNNLRAGFGLIYRFGGEIKHK